jgi:hypothetical protein
MNVTTDNKYEVSLLYPRKGSAVGGGCEVIKAEMAMDDAVAYARAYLALHSDLTCEVWITQSTPGDPTKWITPMHLKRDDS